MNSLAFKKSNALPNRLCYLFGVTLFAALLLGATANAQETPIESDFQVKTDTRFGVLALQFTVPEGWHCFSTTQLPGGPVKSEISIRGEGVKVIGDFVPIEPPTPEEVEGFDVVCETHEGVVIWEAPIEFEAGVDPAKVTLTVKYEGQICTNEPGLCNQVNEKTTAEFVGFSPDLEVPTDAAAMQAAPAVGAEQATPKKLDLEPYQPEGLHATLEGSVWTNDGKQNFKPGDVATLEITAVPLDDYHFYGYSTQEQDLYLPTMIAFKQPEGWQIAGPVASNEPVEHDDTLQHEEATTWSFKVKIPADAAPDQPVVITGGIQLHTCFAEGCDAPSDSEFEVTIPMGTDSAAALKFAPGASGSAAAAVKAGNVANSGVALEQSAVAPSKGHQADDETHKNEVRQDTPEEIAAMAALYNVKEKISYLDAADMEANPIGSGGTSLDKQTSFGIALLFAFVGGAILNLMPCVFPVLGIKVMGFVKQGGEDASKVRMHGLVFAAGLVVSMWILAGGLLIFKNVWKQDIIWGEQMANPHFVGGIIVLLFLLGLNMAGVFEVGTSLTSVGGKVSSKGGYGGSFFSGVLTTLIATPCSGPFLGTAMTYALSQTAVISMVMFTVFGLGIAAPYVLLSFFPPLIKRLPKPGPWMETFKVTMAFALFATVAWFMQTFGAQTGVDGVSYMLMGLVIVGLAAYFYGSFGEGHIATGRRWAFGYVMPALIAACGFWAVFNGASLESLAEEGSGRGEIPWVNWNPGKIKHSLSQGDGQIVWADYTAVW